MAGKRRYGDKQVAQVLRRASEIQASPGQTDGHGLTEEEVIRVGSEVGLSHSAVASALAEMGSVDSDDAQTRWLGAPEQYELEHRVEGDMDAYAWQEVVSELNTTFKQALPGSFDGVQGSWEYRHELGHVRLLATVQDGQTRLRLVAHIDGAVSVGMVIAIASMIISSGIFWSAAALRPWGSALGMVLVCAFIALTFRQAVATSYAKDRRKVGALMDRLTECVAPDSYGLAKPTRKLEEIGAATVEQAIADV